MLLTTTLRMQLQETLGARHQCGGTQQHLFCDLCACLPGVSLVLVQCGCGALRDDWRYWLPSFPAADTVPHGVLYDLLHFQVHMQPPAWSHTSPTAAALNCSAV